MARQRILVVDDEPQMQELVRLYLVGAGYGVAEAADGREALDRLRSEAFDLVILDLMLPGLDGWEVCRQLREESDLPVIMLTARGEVDDRVQGLRLGADDYIAKPFDGRELVARVEAVLRRSQPLAASDRPLSVGDLTIHPASRTVT